MAAILGGCGARGDLDDGSALDPSIVGSVPGTANADAAAPAASENPREAGADGPRVFSGRLPEMVGVSDAGDASSEGASKSPPQLPYSLVVHGTGFEEFEGVVIGVTVVRMPAKVIVEQAWTMVAGASFFVPFPTVLQEGLTYQVNYFADQDADSICKPAIEPAWRVELPAAEGDVDLAVAASDATYAAACAAF